MLEEKIIFIFLILDIMYVINVFSFIFMIDYNLSISIF